MADLFAMVDTETTGFPSDENARVIEVAVAIFERGALDPIRTYSSLIRPDVLTDEGRAVVVDICHIDPEDILSARTPDEVLPEVLEAIGDLPVSAYNLGFDRPMLIRTLPGMAHVFERPLLVGDDAEKRRERACAMDAFTYRFRHMTTSGEDGYKKFFSLARAMKLVGVEFEGQAHRALTDAIAAGRVAGKLEQGVSPPEMPKSAPIRPRSNSIQATPSKSLKIRPTPSM